MRVMGETYSQIAKRMCMGYKDCTECPMSKPRISCGINACLPYRLQDVDNAEKQLAVMLKWAENNPAITAVYCPYCPNDNDHPQGLEMTLEPLDPAGHYAATGQDNYWYECYVCGARTPSAESPEAANAAARKLRKELLR